MTTGDAFNLHFTKSVKVVVVETLPQQGSTEYSIPLNSSIRFSPLYNPHENLEEAKKGYRFQSVAEILAQKVLPKLLRVTRGYTGSNSENSLSESEIVLVLKSMKNKLTGKCWCGLYIHVGMDSIIIISPLKLLCSEVCCWKILVTSQVNDH